MWTSLSWVIALIAPASAATVEDGWAAFRAGDAASAERIAADRIAASSEDLGAHRLHLRARAQLDGDGAAIAEARAAHVADPTDPARRLLLADTLVEAWRFDPSWCAEIDRLLGLTPAGDLRFWAHALRWRAATRRCRDALPDPGAERLAALAVGHPDLPGAPAVLVALRTSDGIDDEDAARLVDLLRREPALLGRFDTAWEVPESRGAKRVRKVAMDAAIRALDGEDPVRMADAALVLTAAESPRLAEAEARLAVLHPDPHRYGLARQIGLARRHADPARALERVEALEPALSGAPPEIRASWWDARGDLSWEAGQIEPAITAWRTAWQTTPEDGARANVFAYRAASQGLDLERALEAADVAVRTARAERFVAREWSGESWEAWRERTAQDVGSALDTRGWTLFQLGRPEQAVDDLLQASRAVDVPVVHLHAGLTLAALGELDAAAPHLARGVQERDPREAAVVARGWTALEAWWAGAGRWHPAGVRGWVDDVVGEAAPAPTVQDRNPLVGQALPAVRVRMDGRDLDLASLDGPLVLDFWATWCGPCVEGLPKLTQLASEHPDVRFVTVSVDTDQATMDGFFEGVPSAGFERAWWSAEQSPYEVMSMSGVPSVFVIGADRKVRSYLLGSDVNRLGEAVEAVSGGPTE